MRSHDTYSYEELLTDNDDDGLTGGDVKNKRKDIGRWIKDDIDEPVDLMSHTALQHILS